MFSAEVNLAPSQAQKQYYSQEKEEIWLGFLVVLWGFFCFRVFVCLFLWGCLFGCWLVVLMGFFCLGGFFPCFCLFYF